MFPLNTANFPSSASDLERLLNESLERVFISKPHPVTLSDHSYPRLSQIDIALDGARLRPEPLRAPITSGEISSALEIDQLTVNASSLSVGPVALNLSISAREVQLGQSRDSDEQIVLFLQRATEGNINISMRQSDLEVLITELARNQANKQGITIEGVQLTLRQEKAHSLAAEVNLRAKKLFLGASLRVTGQLDLDDQLNLKISGLNCTGEGGMASLACSMLTPHLRKIENREFPLMLLPRGEIQLHDVRVTVGDRLGVTAEFDSAA